jgi:hypothetical protein
MHAREAGGEGGGHCAELWLCFILLHTTDVWNLNFGKVPVLSLPEPKLGPLTGNCENSFLLQRIPMRNGF